MTFGQFSLVLFANTNTSAMDPSFSPECVVLPAMLLINALGGVGGVGRGGGGGRGSIFSCALCLLATCVCVWARWGGVWPTMIALMWAAVLLLGVFCWLFTSHSVFVCVFVCLCVYVCVYVCATPPPC